ncbi:hypothetical protein CSKR_110778 [Clonorchis sinensis]|uniref:G-protein coupled receptors family 1 profile domain-containing protein n=1 Tax=Clonorchis sinensis TaxID=79923 RepID=A0A419Q1Y4_CLOSI|nr:hypothetical protein CSKR_110778 [Clonorchis sinensis]
MNQSDTKPCVRNILIGNILGTIGILNLTIGLMGISIWTVYLLSKNNSRKSPQGHTVRLIGVTTEIATEDTDEHVKTGWPTCALRPSSKFFLLCIFMSDLLGLCTSNLRFTLLCLVGKDVRLMCGDWCCRVQLVLAYNAGDLSAWFTAIVCAERFLIMLLPTSTYTRNLSRIFPALIISVSLALLTFLTNLFLLIPTEAVCNGSYTNFSIIVFKMVYASVLPFVIVSVSTTGSTVILLRHWNSTRKKNQNRNSKIVTKGMMASQLMLVTGIIFLAGTLPVFVNNLVNPYCCILTAPTNCTLADYRFNAICLAYWTTVCLRTYLLIIISGQTRQDIKQLINQVCSHVIQRLH